MNNKAQSISEYLIIFTLVVAALAISQKFISKAVSFRFKQVQEEMSYKANDKTTMATVSSPMGLK